MMSYLCWIGRRYGDIEGHESRLNPLEPVGYNKLIRAPPGLEPLGAHPKCPKDKPALEESKEVGYEFWKKEKKNHSLDSFYVICDRAKTELSRRAEIY
ncbi:hypothetical protein TNCV_15271 [Trichonephila clavipes]|nr:hypothetical protein TNCV_15271 [Trichonephila clavipes]